MSKVTYATKIGGYDEDVYVDIDLRIADGLTKEDYETIRVALQTIEDITLQYQGRPQLN